MAVLRVTLGWFCLRGAMLSTLRSAAGDLGAKQSEAFGLPFLSADRGETLRGQGLCRRQGAAGELSSTRFQVFQQQYNINININHYQ